MNYVSNFIYYFGVSIEYVGILIVVIAIVGAILNLLLKRKSVEKIRAEMANNIIFGLEFIIAAAILLVTVARSFSEIIQLGGIVLIRILLGYSLRKELSAPVKIHKIK